MKSLMRPVILYFWLNAESFRLPASIWSPWRSRKLSATEAVLRASDAETDEGSLRKSCTVLNAPCFSAKVVSFGGALLTLSELVVRGDCDGDVDICEKRDCSSFMRLFAVAGDVVERSFSTGSARPMRSAGTETPAWPRRDIAP